MRQIDLRHVAGDHGLRAEAEPRQEHAHLLARRVLRLVQDHERVVQRAAAHERERRDLDLPPLAKLLDALEVEHVVQRVVERAQVGVDLLREVARQKSELFAGLDRRAAEDDALDALLNQRRSGHRHREVRLAGARGTDAEREIVRPDGLDVVALSRRLRHDRTPSRRDENGLVEQIDERRVRVRAKRTDRARDVVRADLVAASGHLGSVAQEAVRELHALVAARHVNDVAAQVHLRPRLSRNLGEHDRLGPRKRHEHGGALDFETRGRRVVAGGSRDGNLSGASGPELWTIVRGAAARYSNVMSST